MNNVSFAATTPHKPPAQQCSTHQQEELCCHINHGPIRTKIDTKTDRSLDVQHSIVVVEGRIETITRECNCSKVHVQHLHNNETIASINQNIACRPAGLFKSVLELRPGKNILQFSYCNAKTATHSVCVTYSLPPAALWSQMPIVRILYAVPERHADLASPNVLANTERCMLAVRLAQALYAYKLDGNTFRVEPECRPVRLHKSVNSQQLTESQLWYKVAEDIIRAEIRKSKTSDEENSQIRNVDRIKYVVILEGRSVLIGVGAQALCVLGVPHIDFWPGNVRDVADALNTTDDRQHNHSDSSADDISMRRNSYASAVGALCHEMGHVFGAGHTADGIMSGNIDRVGRVFSVDAQKVFGSMRRVTFELKKASANAALPIDRRLTKVRGLVNLGSTDNDNDITSQKSSNRLSSGVQMLQQYHEQLDADQDLTWFAPCSHALLLENRWIRGKPVMLNSATMVADLAQEFHVDWEQRRVMCGLSVATDTKKADVAVPPLRMVELRADDGMMLAWWRFADTENRREFQVPTETDQNSLDCGGIDVNDDIWMMHLREVVVIDASGKMETFRNCG